MPTSPDRSERFNLPQVARDAEEVFASKEALLDDEIREKFIKGYEAAQRIIDKGLFDELQQIMKVACISQAALDVLVAAVTSLGEKWLYLDFMNNRGDNYESDLEEEET